MTELQAVKVNKPNPATTDPDAKDAATSPKATEPVPAVLSAQQSKL